MIWNKPRVPQKNGVVERNQGVLANWTEYQKAKDSFDLQIRLWKQAEFYNYHFPIRRFNAKKRIEQFPSLPFTGRIWNPINFNLQRVLDFLQKGTWERKVSANGQISLYQQRFSVGIKFKYQTVSISIDTQSNLWKVFAPNGALIKSIKTPFSTKAIWNLLTES